MGRVLEYILKCVTFTTAFMTLEPALVDTLEDVGYNGEFKMNCKLRRGTVA